MAYTVRGNEWSFKNCASKECQSNLTRSSFAFDFPNKPGDSGLHYRGLAMFQINFSPALKGNCIKLKDVNVLLVFGSSRSMPQCVSMLHVGTASCTVFVFSL